MKYAVAYMNYFDNDLKLTIVEADNPITAMIEGAREMMEAPDDDEWLNEKLENIPSPDGYADRIEEIRVDFFDTDQTIAVMPVGRLFPWNRIKTNQKWLGNWDDPPSLH